MNDLVASVFKLSNSRFFMAPKIDFRYLEEDTGVRWHITAGGSRAYTLRRGPNVATLDSEAIGGQNADSHLMMDRVKSALLVGGAGLFQAESVGRIFFKEIPDEADWFTLLDFPTSPAPEPPAAVYDWLGAMNRHTMLRRAGADAHAALSNPHEAGTFVYRGFEWLVVGENRRWDDLAEDIGVSKRNVMDFKKLTNVDHGVRHASSSGVKLRADLDNYGNWVVTLMDAMNATRARLESSFERATPEVLAEAVVKAVPADPFP